MSNYMSADQDMEQLIPGIDQECFWHWNLTDDRVSMSRHYCEHARHISGNDAFDMASIRTIIHPADQQKFFDGFSALCRDEKDAASIEYRMVTKSGSIRWIEFRREAMEHAEDGSVSGIVGSVFDITERIKAKEALSRLNRSLLMISKCSQAILHASNETELLNDICRIVVEIGQYRMAWVGYARNDDDKSVAPVAQVGFEEGYLETLGLSWADIDRGRGPTGTAIRTGKESSMRNMQTDPGLIPWRSQAMARGYSSCQSLPLKNEGGVLGALTIYSSIPDAFDAAETNLLGSLADNLAYGISMLQGRKAREKAEEAMRQSEARYRSLFQNRHIVMLIIDPEDGSIVDANPAAVAFYGWELDELFSMKICQINLTPTGEPNAEMEPAHAKQCNTSLCIHRLSDGSLRDVEVISDPITIQGKRLLYSIVNDVTDRKMEEEKKVHLESHLRNSQRLETIGTLAGGIAHDFNNILMPILGYAEMGVIGDPAEDALNEYFTEIMRAAERAKNLISQILTFSRAQEVTRSVISIQAVVEDALRVLAPSIPATVRIEQHIDQSCSNILADPSQIQQVIVNLCNNALDSMVGSGGGLITISLSEVVADSRLKMIFPKMEAEQPYVQLTISDNGCGMDEETMARIFEPFFTTKQVSKGTGLGLSMVHGIVIGHRGEITVESTPGKGTSFNVYLPVVDEEIDSLLLETTLSPINCSVLFVDDEPDSLKMMTLMMNKLGFRIRALSSPLKALELFRQDPSQFDLVITDLTMPEMKGVDFAEALHQISPRLPIILMTGYGKDIEYIKPMQQYGISRILKKPVKMGRLSSTINELLVGD
ncbi:MAG: PAS domain S-box protein [Chlorobiaceae bacterium]|nr:PAS domain S-box protein [Chlorobiaceae bacterium]